MTNYLINFAKKYSANYEGLSKYCWQGITLIFINAFTIGICFFLSLYFVNYKHLTVSMAGILLSCYGLGTVAGGFFTGKWADRISPRSISIASLLTQSLAFFLLTYLQSTITLMPNLFLLGFAAYGFKTSNNVWMLGLCADNLILRYKTISLSHVSSNLGLGLSGILIGSLEAYGFQPIFNLSSLLLFCSALYLLLQNSKDKVIPLSTREKHSGKYANNSPIIVMVLSCVFFVGLIIAQLGATYPLYVHESFPSMGVQAVSILFILDTFLIVFFQAPLTTLVSQQNKLLVIGSGALLMGLGMLVLSFASTFVIAIISCIIWTTGEMLFVSTAQLVCYEQSNNKKKGRNLGLFQTTFATSNVAGPMLGGILYQHWGGNLLWYCSMGVGVWCFLLCWYFSCSHTDTTS